MPLVRSPLQSEETLEEFYRRDSWSTEPAKTIASKMLELALKINELFPKTILYCSTSHQRLCLHQAGEEELNWVQIVSYSPIHVYHVTYKIPQSISPWEDAWISGECSSKERSIEYFLIAMKNTGYWENNSELEAVLKSY